jgi:hypothetical protein
MPKSFFLVRPVRSIPLLAPKWDGTEQQSRAGQGRQRRDKKEGIKRID